MLKLRLPTTCLLGLTLIVAGCSSSQPSNTTTATASSPTDAVSSDPQVNAAIEQSCSQCHTTNGKVPWYATVSPTYLAANSARKVLNFSDWQTYDDQKRSEALKAIEQSVQGGSMPPGDYTALDHSARLTDEQKQALLKWAAAPAH
ncbi:MAG TPA: heme-binding domain-containing protein [Candidatus Binatus sp.]|nr:heme-binding domain-containing protein [Candidatus Binatus sp.]